MSHVFEQLDREWRRLCRDRRLSLCLQDARRQAESAASLAELEWFVRQAPPEPADRVLLSLVTTAVTAGSPGTGRAADEQSLACRVLLQLLLPGTRRMARRWWAIGNEDERAQAAVAAVYHRIRNYPLERRPGRVAANILMDAERELRRAVPSPDVEPHDTPPEPQPAAVGSTLGWGLDAHPAIELAGVLRDAAGEGVIGHDDAVLIARSRIGGDRIPDLATCLGLRPRTIWDRRRRAEQALADHYLTA